MGFNVILLLTVAVDKMGWRSDIEEDKVVMRMRLTHADSLWDEEEVKYKRGLGKDTREWDANQYARWLEKEKNVGVGEIWR